MTRSASTHRHFTLAAVILGVVLAGGMTTAAAQGAPGAATPVPTAVVVPVTGESYPYMTASRLIEPMDLSALGYVEEEYFISGRANVYDWPVSGDLTVVTPNAPYTTRILVRRPSDPARFSGNVAVEIMHTPNRQDFSLMWGWAHDHFLEHGDAYVAVTVMPVAALALQVFDSARYAPISFANPTPDAPCPGGRAGVGDPSVEEGLRWDMISQVGALLKSNVPGRPLAGFEVEHLYMTTQDAVLQTYINAIHPHARLQDGSPVYDGYVVKGGVRPARINRCAPAIADGDPRVAMQNVGVPVMHVQMEGDFPNAFAGRRADSDAPNDRFRLWEVAGTAHFDTAGYRTGFPRISDMVRGGLTPDIRVLPPEMSGYTFQTPIELGGETRCEPASTTEQPILGYIFNSAFANLDQWVRHGTPPPRAARLEIVNGGTQQMTVVRDEFGNARGGVRTPYVDVPTATSITARENTGRLCRQFGSAESFTWSRLESVYGTYENYAAKVAAAVDTAVEDRWLSESDGRKVKAELLSEPGPQGTATR
jgi:hypothetical protein